MQVGTILTVLCVGYFVLYLVGRLLLGRTESNPDGRPDAAADGWEE